MLRTLSAQRGRLLTLGAISLLVLSALFAAACGDDDSGDPTNTPAPSTPTPTEPAGETPSPAPEEPTITPTPEVEEPQGFEDALDELEDELISGGLDPIIARLLLQEYVCKESDLEEGLGQPECETAGEVIRALELSTWRSEGGLRKVETVVALLQGYSADLQPDATDEWGSGEIDVYAFDSSVNRAVITFMVECQPQFQCEGGVQRGALVLSFEFEDDRWMVSRIMGAFVLYEDFLEPTAEGQSFYFPEWEKHD